MSSSSDTSQSIGQLPMTTQASLAEYFHRVVSVIPAGQNILSVPPDTTVAEAIKLMRAHDYSQVPVLAGDAVLGIFSYRSLVTNLLKMGRMTEFFGDLPVDEFMEAFTFVQPSNDWEALLELLNRDNGVLVGDQDHLQGIVTTMDVLTFLHRIAHPFVVLSEIELSLRQVIGNCVTEEQLQACIQTSMAKKYSPDELPSRLENMTFNDYIQIIGDGRNWTYFEDAFGKGEWQRKNTIERLKQITRSAQRRCPF